MPLIKSLIICGVSDVKQPWQAPSSQTARASAPYRPTIRRYWSRYSSGMSVLGLDDRRFELLELRLVGDDLFVDLLLERGDLGGEPFHLGLELLELGRLGFDGLEADEDFLLDLGLGGIIVGDLVLEGLVLVVLLDLVELDLEVVDLGVDALERMFVFLELDLAVLQCLAWPVSSSAWRLARAAWRAASVLGPEARRSRSALAR